ncbi:MAG: zf-HC2 domain-containing protein, partial [Chloroflexota bacterium]
MNEHPVDELGALALGALDRSERERVDAHLRACATCTAEVAAYSAALTVYAAAVERPPAPALRDRI